MENAKKFGAPRTETPTRNTSVTGVTNETVDNSENEATQSADKGAAAGTTLPLRGFAMVLIAVAVMFGLWALYAFTQDDSSDQASQNTSEQTDSAGSNQAGEQEPGTVGADTAEQSTDVAPPADDADKPEQDGADRDEAKPAPERPEAREADAKGASVSGGSGNAAPAAPLKINVLNNSMTQGLAADVADRLLADGRELGEVGNFSEEILPETTVFFPKGKADAEQVARELADEYDGVARENSNILPDKTRDGITIVLTEN